MEGSNAESGKWKQIMANSDYVQILVESLEKKIEILKDLQVQSDLQTGILSAQEFDTEAFDKTMDEKEELINSLQFMDNGFSSVYNRIKEELVNNKAKHISEIARMQDLIREITDLSSRIQATEQGNDVMFRNRFKSERQQLRQSKATVQAVTGYYKTMTNTNIVQSQYMDSKK